MIVLMPGPPAEMTHMWGEGVAPELERRASAILVSHTLKTAGLGESLVDQTLAPLLGSANPSIGLYARRDGVHVRISAKAPTRAEAWRLIHPLDEQARALLGDHVWGEDDDTLAAGVGRLLRDRGLTLGLMESATGGAIANTITDVAGASDYFRGSLVTYTTQTKVEHGVPGEIPATHGVISRETAEAMARAAREQLGADLGLGPDRHRRRGPGRGSAAGHHAPRADGRRARAVRDVVVLPGPGGGEAPGDDAGAKPAADVAAGGDVTMSNDLEGVPIQPDVNLDLTVSYHLCEACGYLRETKLRATTCPNCSADEETVAVWPSLPALRMRTLVKRQGRAQHSDRKIASVLPITLLDMPLQQVLTFAVRRHRDSKLIRDALLDRRSRAETNAHGFVGTLLVER